MRWITELLLLLDVVCTSKFRLMLSFLRNVLPQTVKPALDLVIPVLI
jgi:hypothetical protein